MFCNKYLFALVMFLLILCIYFSFYLNKGLHFVNSG